MRAAWTFVLTVALVLASCRIGHARRHGRTPHLDVAAPTRVVATRHHIARPHRMPFAIERIELPGERAGRIAEAAGNAEHETPSAEQTVPVARGPPRG